MKVLKGCTMIYTLRELPHYARGRKRFTLDIIRLFLTWHLTIAGAPAQPTMCGHNCKPTMQLETVKMAPQQRGPFSQNWFIGEFIWIKWSAVRFVLSYLEENKLTSSVVLQIIAFDELRTDFKNPIDQSNPTRAVRDLLFLCFQGRSNPRVHSGIPPFPVSSVFLTSKRLPWCPW